MMGKVRLVEATSLISEIQASWEPRSLADLAEDRRIGKWRDR